MTDLFLKLLPIFSIIGGAILTSFIYVLKLRADINALKVKLEADVGVLSKTLELLHDSLTEPLKEIASMAKDVRGIKTDLDWITGRKEKKTN